MPIFDWRDQRITEHTAAFMMPDTRAWALWGPDGDLLVDVFDNPAHGIDGKTLAEFYACAPYDVLLLLHIVEAAVAYTAAYVAGGLPRQNADGTLQANWMWLDLGPPEGNNESARLLALCRAIYSDEPIIFDGETMPDNESTQPVGGLPTAENGERMHAGEPLSDQPETLAALIYQSVRHVRDADLKSLLLSAANYVAKTEQTKRDIRQTIENSLQMLDKLDQPTQPTPVKE
jgi:hypothetical protein